jgi:protein TonB
VFAFVLLRTQSDAQAAANQEFYKGEKVYAHVNEMPEFEGDLTAYLSHHLYYPDSCIKVGIDDGKLLFSFVVDAGGHIADVKLLRGGCGQVHKDSMIRMIKSMPTWKCGRLNGKAVPVRFRLPVQMCFLDD